MDTSPKINWHSEDSHVLLNSRMPTEEKETLEDLSIRYAKPSHIWIASSGSSKSSDQSLKLIALSKKAFLTSAQAVNAHLKSDAHDVWLQTLPRFHVGGLSIEARAFLSGAKLVTQKTWNAEEFLQISESQHVTLSALVPTQIYDLVQMKKKAPSSFRAVVIGGAALPQDLYQQAVALDWPILPSYGMTECCSQIATSALEGWKRNERALQLLSHVEARVTSDRTLEIRSPALMSGYAQVLSGIAQWTDPKIDGWYRTQDKVQIEGRILIPLGRDSDFVKISGEGVDLEKLRALLDQTAQQILPSTWQNLNLVAVPDARVGHRIVLQVLKGLDASPVQALFNQKVAPYERIQELQTVDDLPWKKKSPKAW